MRLGERLPSAGRDAALADDRDVQRPLVLAIDRDAAEIGAIHLRVSGQARTLAINWRREGERGWINGRRLVLALDSSGVERSYQVNLAREQAWLGRIAALRVNAEGGPARLREFTLQAATSALRPVSLRGETLPSLLRQGRLAIPITADMPRRARLEARVGVLPEFQRLGAAACFSVAVSDGYGSGDPPPISRTCLPADTAAIHGWRALDLDLDLPSKGHLILDSQTEIGGSKSDLGAVWGDPVLVARTPAAGPNLVLIAVDTVRTDVLGAYGNRDGLTPELDAFAARGVRLAQLHSPAPWTLPSMASLMTGLQPQTHGGGQRLGNEAATGIADGVHTLAETLSRQGFYSTGLYKNIYLNPEFGLDQGFDVYAASETMPGPQGEEIESNAGFLVDRAIAELHRVKDRRFFLYLHLFDPHNPYEAPQPWCDRVARRLQPDYGGSIACRVDRRPEMPMPAPSDFAWIRALYDTEIAYTDHELGRFLAALHAEGLDENSVIAFVSDHGEEFYERLDTERRLGYEPNSDHGHTLYEELLHVPAIIAAPGLAPGVVDDPVQTVDLFQTLLAMVGAPAPRNEGQDLSAVLAGGGRPGAPHAQVEPLIADLLLHGPGRQAVRRGPWKLIRPTQGGHPVELYDLATDPGETDDLSASHPDVVLALRRVFARELESRRRLRGELLPEDSLHSTFLDWSHINKLRSLGYLH